MAALDLMNEDVLDNSEDEEESCFNWVLGFAESPLSRTDLLRHRFPSKIGGRPAWLNPVHLPEPEVLKCAKSGELMKFLLQVYAPVDENPDAFHRTMFVFVTPHATALHASPPGVRVLRCQMNRSNEFYDFDPPEDDRLQGPREPSMRPAHRDPWAVAQHEHALVHDTANADSVSCAVNLFPEYELVVEDETVDDGAAMESEEANLAKMAALSHEACTDEELPTDLVDQIENSMPLSQRHFASFASRISMAPSQVLRYCFEEGSSPLCPSPEGIPSPGSIPSCPHCKGPRRFEFQIMPQILNILGMDPSDDASLDWGTISIYSCAASCSPPPHAQSAYLEEYAWVQPPA